MKFLLLQFMFLPLILGKHFFETDEESCCSLEFLPVLIYGRQDTKAIPREAIRLLDESDENPVDQMYLGLYTESNSPQIAVMTDAIHQKVKYFKRNDLRNLQDATNHSKLSVLSNPEDCTHKWWIGAGGLQLQTTSAIQLVQLEGKRYIGRVSNSTGGHSFVGIYTMDNKKFTGVSMDVAEPFAMEFDAKTGNIDLLYIECEVTMKKMIVTELYDIKMEPFKEGHSEQVIASTIVENNSPTPQTTRIQLGASITSSFQMTHTNKLRTVSETRLNIEGSLNFAGFISKFSIDVAVSGYFDKTTREEKFASEGEIKSQSTTAVYRVSQDLVVEPFTKTTVSIKTRPIEGSRNYTAYYRVKHRKNPKTTMQKIGNFLKRLGFGEQLKQGKSQLEYTSNGTIHFSGSYNTVIEIRTTKIGGDVTNKRVSRYRENLKHVELRRGNQ